MVAIHYLEGFMDAITFVYVNVDWNRATSFVEFLDVTFSFGLTIVSVFISSNKEKGS